MYSAIIFDLFVVPQRPKTHCTHNNWYMRENNNNIIVIIYARLVNYNPGTH